MRDVCYQIGGFKILLTSATALIIFDRGKSFKSYIVKEGETNKQEGGKKAASRIAFVKRKNSVDFRASRSLPCVETTFMCFEVCSTRIALIFLF